MASKPRVPERGFDEVRADLEKVVKGLRALNIDRKTHRKLLRDLRELLAEADRLLVEDT